MKELIKPKPLNELEEDVEALCDNAGCNRQKIGQCDKLGNCTPFWYEDDSSDTTDEILF